MEIIYCSECILCINQKLIGDPRQAIAGMTGAGVAFVPGGRAAPVPPARLSVCRLSVYRLSELQLVNQRQAVNLAINVGSNLLVYVL